MGLYDRNQKPITARCNAHLHASRNTNPASGEVIIIHSNLESAVVKKQINSDLLKYKHFN